MNFVGERLHMFDTVRQFIYMEDHRGIEIPEWLDVDGYEKSRKKALYLSRLGLLGEFYKRIMEGTL